MKDLFARSKNAINCRSFREEDNALPNLAGQGGQILLL
jgi:hypothetical protein